MKRITIRDVAREAGVSVTLVSFVMNAKRNSDGRLDCPVNPETAENVLAVAKRLGYRKNPAAASLRNGRMNAIAVIPTDISNKFFAGTAKYIENKARSYGYTVLFGSSYENAENLESIMDAILAYNIDGIIVAPVKGGEKAIQKAIEANIPVVLLDRDAKGLEGNVGKVLLDDVRAGYDATELLIKGGFRKIEMVSYSIGVSSLLERERGYEKCMKEKGLSDNIKIHHTTYEDVSRDVLDIIKDAHARNVEAFFLPTYSLSAEVMTVMKTMNLNTPDDFAIVGFDKSNIYNLFSTPVAHILQPLQELGERSVDMIHNMIENHAEGTTHVLKPILVEGGSAVKTR